MRVVIGTLLSLVERYPPLVDGAFIIIGWVGLKLVLEYLHAEGYIAMAIPVWLSLGLIVVIFAASLAYSLLNGKKTANGSQPTNPTVLAAQPLRHQPPRSASS